MAVELLGEVKDRDASRILIDFLVKHKPGENLRATIIQSLGKLKEEDSVLTISRYLDDPDPRVRANAVEALSQLGKPRDIVDFIKPCINDSNPRVRMNTAIILWQAGQRDESRRIINESIDSPDESIRVRTVYALSVIAEKELASYFYRALDDPNQRMRLYAMKGLGKIGGRDAAKALIDSLLKEKRIGRKEIRKILKNHQVEPIPSDVRARIESIKTDSMKH